MEYIGISVRPYPFAISCDGRYYRRSGSVLYELNGIELQNFLMKKMGSVWDSVAVPYARIGDLNRDALNAFRIKALSRGRMNESQASVSDETLLRDLNLFDNDSLTRAAVLMFHEKPDSFVSGAFIKIAYFAPAGACGQNRASDIIYQDVVTGPLITQADKAIDLLYTKYLKALISYDGLQRVETFMWPQEAFREVLLNAINHKSYERGNPVQIRVYDDRISIWNDGMWPDEVDVAKIFERHPSVLRNPKISNVFYHSGEIESWGSGFDKIREECDKAGAPYPVIDANPKGGVWVTCNACELYMNLMKYGRYYETYPEYQKEHSSKFSEGCDSDETDEHSQSVSGYSVTDEDRKSVDRMMEILSEKLSDTEKEKMLPIVEYLKVNNSITAMQAQSVTGKDRATVLRYLRRLIELGVLSAEGKSVSYIYRRI